MCKAREARAAAAGPARAWGGAEQVVHAVFEGIKGSVRNAVAFIEGLAPLMLAAAQALAQALLDGLRSVLSHAAGFAGDVAQAVLQAVKAVVNGVIDQLNRAVEFTIPGPGPLPGIHVDPPDIPHLARGGIVVAGGRGPQVVNTALQGAFWNAHLPADARAVQTPPFIAWAAAAIPAAVATIAATAPLLAIALAVAAVVAGVVTAFLNRRDQS